MRVPFIAGLAVFAALATCFLLAPHGRTFSDAQSSGASQDALSEPQATGSARPVVVELFTSEGCSDCPPADQLLYRLEQTQPVAGAEIIPLEQHVDYWNSEGWRDPFSSSQFTLRQRDYVYSFNLLTAYTPQMVIDGSAEFVGSDGRQAVGAIARAARIPKAHLRIERRPDAKFASRVAPLRVRLPELSDWNPKHGADVLLAITEDDLASNVTRGENAGAHMNHRAVVRELRSLGRVDSAGSFSADPDLNLSEDWKPRNLHVVAFVQDRSTRRVLGASTLSLSEAAR